MYLPYINEHGFTESREKYLKNKVSSMPNFAKYIYI